MVADLSSSLGLFAALWFVLCAMASALVTDSMLRSNNDVSAPQPTRGMLDGTGQHAGE